MISLKEKKGQIYAPRFPSGRCNSSRSFCLLICGHCTFVSAVTSNLSVATGSNWLLGMFFFLALIFRSEPLQRQRSMAANGCWRRCSGPLAGSNTPDFHYRLFAIFLGSILYISHKTRKNTKIDKNMPIMNM